MSEWFSHFGFEAVGDRLLAGAYPLDAADVEELAQAGVEVAYKLCEDSEYEGSQRDSVVSALAGAGIQERRLPLTDYGGLDPRALEQAVADVVGELEAGRRVYLHCRAGWQRSAAVAAAVIALREGMALPQALDVLRERKPTAEPLPHQRTDLLSWWRSSKLARRCSGAGGGFPLPGEASDG
jgi:Dual specificity phosphatase, catalytic domain